MAITDNQKVDYLFKKIGYSVAKTDMANVKSPSNESIASPLIIRGGSIWTQSDIIPDALPVSNSSVVALYNDSLTSTVQAVNDGTASTNRTWKTNLTDWIDASFGSTYQVKVYLATTGNAAPQTYGTQLFADGSGSSDEWFFDYAAGVLNFIGNALPSGSFTGKSIFVSGARYVGSKGLGNLGNVSFNGNISADEIYEAGYRVLTTNSNIQVNGDVVGYGTYSNVYVTLPDNGVTAGVYGSGDDEYADRIPKITVDSKGRITNIANVLLTQVGNVNFNDTTVSTTGDLTVSATGNIILDAQGTGIVVLQGTDAVQLPTGDSSTRPGDPQIGYTRFNTDAGAIEYWDGTTWTTPGFSTITSETINPDGTANTFTLTSNTTTYGIFVSINGTVQQPVTAYNVYGNNQIQFTEIPLSSDSIEVRHFASGITIKALQYGNTKVETTTTEIEVTGNLVPTANLAYNLGSETHWWKDLYLSGNTIHLGGMAITNNNGVLTSTVGGAPTKLQADDPVDLQDVVTLNYLNTQLSSLDATIIQADDTSIQIIDSGTSAGNIVIAVDGSNIATLGPNAVSIARAVEITGNISANNFNYANGVSILDPVMSAWQANAGAQAGVIVAANLAMKGYVDGQITSLINGAPSTLDTLNELATALGSDANLSVTLTSYIGNVNANITTANTAMKGYVDAVTTSWTANAGAQAGALATITANLGSVAGSLATLTSNAAVQAGVLASKADLAGATFTGNISVTGNITQNSVVGGIIPAGGIIMWSGNIAAIPTGWALCNGSNGTPDLRDRFIVGAGSTYSVAGTGGSKDATLPSHTHTATSTFSGSALGTHTHTGSTNSTGGHTHTVLAIAGGGGSILASSGSRDPGTATTSNAGVHSHTVTISNDSAGTPSGDVSTSLSTEGASATNANLPPYYALAFIMKL